MYTEEQLRKYRYFTEQLEITGLEHITDPLTGVISRKYILDFAASLISDNIHFTFGMIDLDNFKFINDTYGHHAGDGILSGVSSALSEYMKDFGILGRYGGDELIFIDLRHITYTDKKTFLDGIYNDSRILRWNYELDDCTPFITGTIGCATFPDDARDYDELFSMIDKTLYRGKNKGRNCYIIYVEEKHRNIEIQKMAGHSFCTVTQSLARQFELAHGAENRLNAVLPLLTEELCITDLYYTDKSFVLRSVLDKNFREIISDIENIMNDDIYSTNEIEELEDKAPIFYEVMKKHSVETVLVTRIGRKQDTDGFLICAEPQSHRIWQDDECVLIYFLAKIIAAAIRIDGDVITEK